MDVLALLYSIYFGVTLGAFIVGVNIIMFSFLLPLKMFLPDKMYWSAIKYFFTQYQWKWALLNRGQIKLKFEGESASLPKGEPAIMISNHQDDLDFGTHIFAYMENDILSCETKWVAKRVVSFIPFIGWVHWLIGDLFLRRSWEQDAVLIKEWLRRFKERQFKRIVIFPEGTRSRNKKKLKESQEFAAKNGFPVLEHVLYPRTKGFSLIAKFFRDNPGTVDYVYDYTFGYHPDGVGLEQFAQGPIPVDIHVYVTRHRLSDIGTDEKHFAAWCVKRFQLKDQLLKYFGKHHHFPSTPAEAAQFEKTHSKADSE